MFRGGRGSIPPKQAVRRLALSRGITFAGGGGAYWALSVVLYAQTHSATLVAVAALASFSVPALLSPAAGLLGDHFDRRYVMALSELGGAVCFGLMTFFTAPLALLGLRFLASIAAAPLVPATSAAIPLLVPSDELEHANAALSKAGTAGILAGPATAAIVLAAIGGRWVFLLNTVTFVVSACLILSIKRRACPRASTQRNPVVGFTFLWRHPVLRPVGFAYGMAFVGIGVSIPAEVAIVASFGQGSTGYAALVCLWGLGMIAGATAGERLGNRPQQLFIIGAAAAILAFGCLGVAVAPLFVFALLGMVVVGLGAGLWEVCQGCLLQRATPDEFRTRVLAANEAWMQGGVAVGLAISGLIIGATGGRGGFAAAATTSAIAAVILLLHGISHSRAASEVFPQEKAHLADPGASRARLLPLPKNHVRPTWLLQPDSRHE
ncbi:MAG: MFS transporter [Solirubrobacterales bacterium]